MEAIEQPGVPAYRIDQFRPASGAVALVIPVINESNRLTRQLREIQQLGLKIDVIVADGGSTDGSTEPSHLKDLGVSALLTKIGPGRLSAQLRMGFHHCLNHNYQGVVTMDGNGKDGVDGIMRIADSLARGNDFVQGSRFVAGGQSVNLPLLRHLSIRLIHAPITSIASKHRFTDSTNGFRGFSREFLQDPRVGIFRDVFDGYELLAYLPIRAGRTGHKLAEVPVARCYPPSGPTPTKIHGVGALFRLLSVLVSASLGRYNPD